MPAGSRKRVRVGGTTSAGLSEDEARARMVVQVDDDSRRAAATYVIDNSGSREALEPQVRAMWERLTG